MLKSLNHYLNFKLINSIFWKNIENLQLILINLNKNIAHWKNDKTLNIESLIGLCHIKQNLEITQDIVVNSSLEDLILDGFKVNISE